MGKKNVKAPATKPAVLASGSKISKLDSEEPAIPSLEQFKSSSNTTSTTTPTPTPSAVTNKVKANAHLHQNLQYAIVYTIFVGLYVWIGLINGTLIQDPAGSMRKTIPALIVLQLWYCLSGGLDAEILHVKRHLRDTPSPSSSSSLQGGKRRRPEISIATSFSPAILATLLSLIMSVLVFGLLVLFGAPASTLVYETFLCAVHISILSVQPLVFVYNLDSDTWKDIISAKLPLNGVYGAAVGTWVGAWMGAIPIPLDWDRPWQQWPITILLGSYIGTVIGTLVGAAYRKFRSSK